MLEMSGLIRTTFGLRQGLENLAPPISVGSVLWRRPLAESSGVFELAKTPVEDIAALLSGLKSTLLKRYVRVRDGIGVFDPTTKQIVGAFNPGATVEEMFRLNPDQELGEIVARTVPNQNISFSGAGAQGQTTGDGKNVVDLMGKIGETLAFTVPSGGGVAQMSLNAPQAAPGTARVLLLPKNYPGPLVVWDIDQTQRDTNLLDLARGITQKPIRGVEKLKQRLRDMGIPQMDLSAGPHEIREWNVPFLAQMNVQSILIDNPGFDPLILLKDNASSADEQAAFKTQILREVRDILRRAQLFGVGDNKFRDAFAYTAQGVDAKRAYIHDVTGDPQQPNLPAGWQDRGNVIVLKDYTDEEIDRICEDIQSALKAVGLERGPIAAT
jgi:hypothetical protein